MFCLVCTHHVLSTISQTLFFFLFVFSFHQSYYSHAAFSEPLFWSSLIAFSFLFFGLSLTASHFYGENHSFPLDNILFTFFVTPHLPPRPLSSCDYFHIDFKPRLAYGYWFQKKGEVTGKQTTRAGVDRKGCKCREWLCPEAYISPYENSIWSTTRV